MSGRIGVLIVDDSAFVRRATERMLTADGRIGVVGHATNGHEAIEQVEELRPDVVIMDINMPQMDGLEALEHIMREMPTPVILFSTLTREGAETTLRGLDLGAIDFLDKQSVGPLINLYDLGPMLRESVINVAGADVSRVAPAPPDAARTAAGPPPTPRVTEEAPRHVVAIGTSTGGPRALTELLGGLPGDFEAAMVVAQHMPEGFTGPLAERLDRHCALRVEEAADREPLRSGVILIIPGRHDGWVESDHGELVLRVSRPADAPTHHPSVDRLFESLAGQAAETTIGVVLTGMGSDGARGAAALRAAGGRILAESERTAVIFGMPRAAEAEAHDVLDLAQIGPALTRLVARDGRAGHRTEIS